MRLSGMRTTQLAPGRRGASPAHPAPVPAAAPDRRAAAGGRAAPRRRSVNTADALPARRPETESPPAPRTPVGPSAGSARTRLVPPRARPTCPHAAADGGIGTPLPPAACARGVAPPLRRGGPARHLPSSKAVSADPRRWSTPLAAARSSVPYARSRSRPLLSSNMLTDKTKSRKRRGSGRSRSLCAYLGSLSPISG